MSSLAWTVYAEFVGIYILVVWAMYLPFRGGQLYSGPIYCALIGAYGSAMTAKNYDWPFGWALLLGLAVGTFIGFLTSFAFSRSAGLVTATASLALIFILSAALKMVAFVGGSMGIMNIPHISYLPIVIWICVLLVGLFIYRVDSSRAGRALEAERTDPDLAKTLGVNMPSLNVFSMTISSLLGALAGGFFSFTVGAINPDSFTFSLLLSTMAMLFIGGRYTMWGVIIAVPILTGLPLWVPYSVRPYMDLVTGALLVIVLVLRPEGIISRELLLRLTTWGKSWFRRNKEESLPSN